MLCTLPQRRTKDGFRLVLNTPLHPYTRSTTYLPLDYDMTSPNDGSVVNQAFKEALQNHLDQWKSDPRSFSQCATLEDLRNEIKEHGNNYQKTRVSSYTSKLSSLIDRFEGFFSLVDTLVSLNPTIAAHVWGGIRFIIRVRELPEHQPSHSSTSDRGH